MLLELAWLACYGFIMQIADGFIENSNTLCIEKLYDWRYTIRTICIRIRIVDDVVGVGRLFVKTHRERIEYLQMQIQTCIYGLFTC